MERPSFIRMDGPKHDAQRKVVSPIVAPGNLANMEKLIRERTCTVLDDLPKGQTFDWVEEVSIKLTTMMLATMFDWPFERAAELTRWSDIAIANVRDPDAPVKSEDERFAELKKMAEAIAEIYNKRANEPPKFDLLSMLAHGAATKDMPLREFMGNLALADRRRQRHDTQLDDRRPAWRWPRTPASTRSCATTPHSSTRWCRRSSAT